MSPNARRRCSKIVAEPITGKEQELIGGLKNALERGEPLSKAKQSFVNAGYKPAEVAMAVQKMPTSSPQIKKQITAPAETPINSQPTNTKTKSTPKLSQPKKLSKTFKIIMISISIIILIGAVVLGLFWDKIF